MAPCSPSQRSRDHARRVGLGHRRGGRTPAGLGKLRRGFEALFLPGGSGGSRVDFVLGAGPFLYSNEVRTRFDLVGCDMDLLRRAVGDAKLTYAGYSYGSYLGATDANLFPGKVRALIVDGVLDPVAWSTGRDDQARRRFSACRGAEPAGTLSLPGGRLTPCLAS